MADIERRSQAARARALAEERDRKLVNQFAERHGDYHQYAETGESRKAMQNHGGTTLDRWKTGGQLSDSQQAAILHCQRLWSLMETGARVVANLDRTVFGVHGDGNPRAIGARLDLKRISSGFPANYWMIFEDVCRFDEPAGVAGSRMANNRRSSIEAARVVVCMVADMIAMRERLSY